MVWSTGMVGRGRTGNTGGHDHQGGGCDQDSERSSHGSYFPAHHGRVDTYKLESAEHHAT
jgi:hypothetical protein